MGPSCFLLCLVSDSSDLPMGSAVSLRSLGPAAFPAQGALGVGGTKLGVVLGTRQPGEVHL